MNDLSLPPSARRRRRLSRPAVAVGLLGALAAIGLLWLWVFTPIFISPEAFFARQKRFDRAIREVVAFRAGGPEDTLPRWPPPLTPDRVAAVMCAEKAVIRGVRHAPQPRTIPYPFGDIPEHLGTSADLLVRCLRATGIDLQQLIHHDRKTDPKRYPTALYRSRKVDPQLDHRRVAFQFAFARAFLPDAPVETDTPEAAALFLPGDIVFWSKDGREGHPGLVGFVSDRRDETGMPLVYTIVPDEERATHHHRLDEWPILGHFRLDVETMLERFLGTWPDVVLQRAPHNSP
jgi:uncharacterized protein YijF (DUF1287 family)